MNRNHLITEIQSLIDDYTHDFPAVASILHYICAALITKREGSLALLIDWWGQQHLRDGNDSYGQESL